MLAEQIKNAVGNAGLRRTRLWGWLKIAYNDHLKKNAFARMRADCNRTADFRMLVINHYFDGEIEALKKTIEGATSASYLSLTPEPFFSRAIVYFSEEVHAAKIPYDDPALSAAKKLYREYCNKLFNEIVSFYPFDCMITPSDSFYWLREFISVCKMHEKPVIVVDKEGTISKLSFETLPSVTQYLFPPIADYYFLWSERQSLFWQRAGVRKEQIRVIGSPRTDLFVNIENVPKRSVVVFDFDSDAYINAIDWSSMHWDGERNWNYLRRAYHRTLVKLAKNYPQIDFILKCHPQQVVTELLDPELNRLSNVKIITGAPRGIPAMVAEAFVVIGFQTTALIEAALTDTPVIYAGWGDLHHHVSSQILPWFENGYGIFWCRSENEVYKRVSMFLNGEIPEEQHSDRSKLSTYFFNPDGNVTKRLVKALTDVSGKKDNNGDY